MSLRCPSLMRHSHAEFPCWFSVAKILMIFHAPLLVQSGDRCPIEMSLQPVPSCPTFRTLRVEQWICLQKTGTYAAFWTRLLLPPWLMESRYTKMLGCPQPWRPRSKACQISTDKSLSVPVWLWCGCHSSPNFAKSINQLEVIMARILWTSIGLLGMVGPPTDFVALPLSAMQPSPNYSEIISLNRRAARGT